MSVVIWFENSMDTVTAEGDLIDLINGLNLAQASGKTFVGIDTSEGPEMVNTKLIIRAREVTNDAFVGGN